MKFQEGKKGKDMRIRRTGEMVVSTLLKMGGVCLTQAIWMAVSSKGLDIAPTRFAFGCNAVAHQTVDITKTVTEKGALSVCSCRRFRDVGMIHLWHTGDSFFLFIYLFSRLECFAPARLTRVIAQASLGSPEGLCGFACWVGGRGIWLETSLAYGKFSLHCVWRFMLQLEPRDLQFDVSCEHFSCIFFCCISQYDFSCVHFCWKIICLHFVMSVVFTSDMITDV